MKQIILFFIIALELFGAVVRSPIVGINEDASEVMIKVENIDVGVSGFVIHEIAKGHSSILKNAVVKSFDENSKIAKIGVTEFSGLVNSALPNGKWSIKVGDTVVLAFGYSRGLLIAPNEEIYHRVTKSSELQWVHPDIFATILSFNGHPSPLRSDFAEMSSRASVGLVFIYLDKRVYTLDARSFKILNITDANLEQKETTLPFYTRVPKIDAAWWGEGSNELDEYEPHYYRLMVEANPQNRKLLEVAGKNAQKKRSLLEQLGIKR